MSELSETLHRDQFISQPLAAEVAHLRTERDKLRAALRPFAELGGKLQDAPNLIGLLTHDDFERAMLAYGQSDDR